MEYITAMDGLVQADRQFVVSVPENIPIGGKVTLTLVWVTDSSRNEQPLTRETARAKLLAVGHLSTSWHEPDGFEPMTDAELQEIGRRDHGSRTAQDYIDEERGTY